MERGGGYLFVYNALRDLVPFVQFRKREKNPWRSVAFSKLSGLSLLTLLKVTLLHGNFSRFLNHIYKWYQIVKVFSVYVFVSFSV